MPPTSGTPGTPTEVVGERGLDAVMADGTRLVADAWRPAGTGRWPVLLQRLPYGRAVASAPVLPSPTLTPPAGFRVATIEVLSLTVDLPVVAAARGSGR